MTRGVSEHEDESPDEAGQSCTSDDDETENDDSGGYDWSPKKSSLNVNEDTTDIDEYSTWTV